ncbi:MAG: glutathione peroxidase [Pseudomonadota bacterium]|nr:glutathione peroxidase [Pseudomonadota bacterium]
MRISSLATLFLFWLGVQGIAEEQQESAHDFAFVSIDGEPLPLSMFSGKAVLIVNTASFCGFTKQYAKLQTLHERYAAKGLVVLGVPSNDFGGQEPGKSDEIKSFCEVNYGINFPLTEKVRVKGEDVHPFYAWAAEELGFVARPRWNFHKYLVNRNGELVTWFSSPTSPLSSKVLIAIERALLTSSDDAV